MQKNKPHYFRRKPKIDIPRTNHRIRSLDVQVINSAGENLGTLPIKKAIEQISKKSKFSEIELKEFRERMKEHNIIVKLNRTAKDIIVENGYNEKYGARPLQRAIQTYIEDPIAEEMLQGTLKTGMVASLSYDKRTDKIKVSSRDAVQGIDY